MKRAFLFVILALAACKEDVASNLPQPVAISDEALGYYCQMNIAEHDGPKGQIHLDGFPSPLFFSQVRDAVAYLREPERVAPVLAVYVSDMAQAPSWSDPGVENWVLAEDAFFVVGSDAIGGMGAPELVPFGREADAKSFAAEHGGTVMQLAEIPTEAVLGAVDRSGAQTEGSGL